MEGIFGQEIGQLKTLRNPDLVRKAFINMLEDMDQARKKAEFSKEQTRRALINMLEDLKKSRDVLEEKNRQLEKALKQLKETTEQLIQTEKVRALGEAMASLSHDIKNILNGLEGGMFIMDEGLQKEDLKSAVKGWKMVKRNIDRIKGLSLDMVFYAKDRKPEYQLTDISHIIQEVCELLQEKAREKNINFKWFFDSLPREVKIDSKGIYRCLLNLITNALDACSEPDSQVIVRLSASDEEYLQIEVTDTGCGIPKDKLKDLFIPFRSTKGYAGTGLGLAVAHKIISEHNGSMVVNSEPGKGTTFIIKLPHGNSKNANC